MCRGGRMWYGVGCGTGGHRGRVWMQRGCECLKKSS